MASFYSDALLHTKPLHTHSTTLTCPKLRLPRRSRIKRLPVVRLGRGGNSQRRPRRQGGRVFFSRLFRRVRLRWLGLRYSCVLKRLKQYYRSLIKDIVKESESIEAYHHHHQKRAPVMESSAMDMARPAALRTSFSHCHGSATLSAPKSILEQTISS